MSIHFFKFWDIIPVSKVLPSRRACTGGKEGLYDTPLYEHEAGIPREMRIEGCMVWAAPQRTHAELSFQAELESPPFTTCLCTGEKEGLYDSSLGNYILVYRVLSYFPIYAFSAWILWLLSVCIIWLYALVGIADLSRSCASEKPDISLRSSVLLMPISFNW